MAIIKKELPLVFQYIQISSPIPFYIYGSDNEKAKRLLPSNAYVLRSAELLTSEKAPNQPIWKVYVEYDDSLLTDGRIVEINGFNVDFSKYLETFGGQLVRFGDDQLQGFYTVINNPSWVSILSTLATSEKQDSIIDKIPSVSTLAKETTLQEVVKENTLKYFMGNNSLLTNLQNAGLFDNSNFNGRWASPSTHFATEEKQQSIIDLLNNSAVDVVSVNNLRECISALKSSSGTYKGKKAFRCVGFSGVFKQLDSTLITSSSGNICSFFITGFVRLTGQGGNRLNTVANSLVVYDTFSGAVDPIRCYFAGQEIGSGVQFQHIEIANGSIISSCPLPVI